MRQNHPLGTLGGAGGRGVAAGEAKTMPRAPRLWPFKSLDSAVEASRKTLMLSSVLIWSTAFLSIFIMWFSLWAERVRPDAGIAGPSIPVAIGGTLFNFAVAVAVNAWARYFPELFRRRFLRLQERAARANGALATDGGGRDGNRTRS